MTHLIVALIIILIIIIIPLILILMHHKTLKKQEEQMLVLFSRLGSLYYLSFTSQEILHNKIIGLDGLRRKILIIEDHNHRYDFRFIDLYEVSACKVKKIYNDINAAGFKENKLEEYLNAIALEFDFKNGSTPVALEFYKGITHNVYEKSELETKAKQWEVMLSKMLSLKTINTQNN